MTTTPEIPDTPAGITELPEAGYVVPDQIIGRVPMPAAGRKHQWVMAAMFRVDDHVVREAAAGMATASLPVVMDSEALITIKGPFCLKCEMPLHRLTADLPCCVDIAYVDGCGETCTSDHKHQALATSHHTHGG